MVRYAAALCLIVYVATPLLAQNPFTQSSSPELTIYTGRVPSFILEWSHALQKTISSLTRSMTREGGGAYGILAFLVAVLFGIIHVAGPGHGKIFTISYFGSRRAKLKEGLLLAGMINIIDSVSAGIIVLIGYGVLTVVFNEFRSDAYRITQLISYGCITAFGVYHLLSHLRHSRHNHGKEHNHSMPSKSASPWPLALSVGLVPCPISTMILVFGLANGILLFSILLVLGVSLGGFITMGALSLAIIGGKKGLTRIFDRSSGKRALQLIEITFSLLIIVIGAAFLIAALF